MNAVQEQRHAEEWEVWMRAVELARRWSQRRTERLDRVLQRNALWVAEARRTPPVYAQDDAA
jgi:hypothetical protein